jgi:putative tryptophan/tyrosine transport system substrate-binding protein
MLLSRHTRRREFIALLSCVAAGSPLAAREERPPFLVGMIGNTPYWPHFREAMRDLGYREGQNVKYELRTDETEPAQLAEAAKELASIPVDVIAAYGSPPSQAAQAATRTIPIVMVAVGDPVRAGLVASLAHPGGNITGTSALGPDVAPKRLQILKQVIPSAVRVALLFNPNNAANIIYRDETETAARDLGISLIQVEVSTVADLDTNLRGILSQHPDALIAPPDPVLQARKVIDFLESNRIPGMFWIREDVLAGGLMSYGASVPDLFRDSATYVQKILQGSKPSDLPVEQPTKFEFTINLTSAKVLGLTIPASLMSLADELIE